MRIDGDALLLLILLGLILVVSLVMPFMGYVAFGLSSAAIAGTLEVGVLLDIRRARRGDDGPTGGSGGQGPPGGGGGSGDREPRRPRRTPPSTSVRRRA